ncbi:MAG: hypothetical protein GEU79_01130 [Acidimicrobiia bacterium]|nr:hypothetical protein [Acidimicrobiia bacterium]
MRHRRRTDMRRLLVLALLASLLVFVRPDNASACSCAQIDPRTEMANQDAAVIATLIEAPERKEISDEDGVWVFRVDRSVKGDLSGSIEVLAPTWGMSCGFEIAAGERTGIFLHKEAGHLHGSLCSTVEPQAMADAVDKGPPVFILAGGGGPNHLMGLDNQGAISAVAEDKRSVFSMCPDAHVLMEGFPRRLVVRQLSTMSVERLPLRVDKDARIAALFCRDPSGRKGMVAITTDGEPSTQIVEVPLGRVLADVPTEVAYLGPNYALTVDKSIELISLETGERSTLYPFEPSPAGKSPSAMPWPAPDGSSLIVMERSFDEKGKASSTAHLYDPLQQKSLDAVAIEGDAEGVTWLDDSTFVISRKTESQERTFLALDTETLETRPLPPIGRDAIRVEDQIASVMDGELVLTARDGDRTVVRTLPSKTHSLVAVMDPATATTPPVSTPRLAPPRPHPRLRRTRRLSQLPPQGFGPDPLSRSGPWFSWLGRPSSSRGDNNHSVDPGIDSSPTPVSNTE